jgi:hypothetical protein
LVHTPLRQSLGPLRQVALVPHSAHGPPQSLSPSPASSTPLLQVLGATHRLLVHTPVRQSAAAKQRWPLAHGAQPPPQLNAAQQAGAACQ